MQTKNTHASQIFNEKNLHPTIKDISLPLARTRLAGHTGADVFTTVYSRVYEKGLPNAVPMKIVKGLHTVFHAQDISLPGRLMSERLASVLLSVEFICSQLPATASKGGGRLMANSSWSRDLRKEEAGPLPG